MSTRSARTAEQIAQTRTLLENIQRQHEGTLIGLIANAAIRFRDPLDYWGDFDSTDCLRDSIQRLAQLDGQKTVYRLCPDEVEALKKKLMSLELGPSDYFDEYIGMFALENAVVNLYEMLTQ